MKKEIFLVKLQFICCFLKIFFGYKENLITYLFIFKAVCSCFLKKSIFLPQIQKLIQCAFLIINIYFYFYFGNFARNLKTYNVQK